jgi:transposase
MRCLCLCPQTPLFQRKLTAWHAPPFPSGTCSSGLRDELGLIYSNPQFADLFSHTGQSAEAPARLALLLVMQFAEGLSDRQAAEAVRSRIDWKYALGLELTDPGFDHSVLGEFRMRPLAGGLEQLLLEAMLKHLQERGPLKARASNAPTPPIAWQPCGRSIAWN